MKVTRFSRARGLIVVDAQIFGVRDARSVSLAIDTACAEIVVTPAIVDDLGYSPRDGGHLTTVRTAIGQEQGYTLRVKQFSALGFTLPHHVIHVFDLATGDDIDGLIGLRFLDQFNYEVRSKERAIRVERVLDLV
jgi:predicted aspartyl protease